MSIIQKLFESKSTQSKAPASTTNVSRHHNPTQFLKCMILYGWVVAKKEKNEKMKISQNFHNPATICVNVLLS